MAHRTHPNRASIALRTLLAALAATSALVGCYSTSAPPGECTTEFAPVCGSDGVTYSNACFAGDAGAAVAHTGPCVVGNTCSSDEQCDIGAICPLERCADADAGVPLPPSCPDGGDCLPSPYPLPPCEPAVGVCEACDCPVGGAPVCGADGVTYGNDCIARCAHAAVASRGACGTHCIALACPPIWCEYGNVIDADGCTTCACNPPPICPPVCDIYCPYGNVFDSHGCETCECNPPPLCPDLLCDLDCEYGKVIDSRGCETCECNPAPPDDLCATDTECAAGLYCDFSMPVCAEPSCLPDAPCPPATCYGSCRPESMCPPIACTLFCEFGFARDATGCETCACNPAPPPPPPIRLCLADTGCATGEYCDHSICFTAPCAPGMACPDVCYGACFGGPMTGGGSSDGGVPTPAPPHR